MGDYEHRSWPAWHRHMTYVFLGLHFLLRLRLDNKKKPCVDTTSSTEINGRSVAVGVTEDKRGTRNRYHIKEILWLINVTKRKTLNKLRCYWL